jgi:CRP-like cAMP-binding protein
LKTRKTIFAQGDPSDGLFFIQTGKVRLSVVSEAGKEATLAILGERDFFGESGLAGQPTHVIRDCNHRLPRSACGEKGDDAGDESRTKTFSHVSKILAQAEHAVSG